MRKNTLKEKIQYKFDNLMAKGTVSLIGILFMITFVVVVVAGLVVTLLDGYSNVNIFKSVWMSLMHAIDAGTIAGDEANWSFLLVMMIVTICGLFITSMLIGILNSGLEEKMTSLRKGKSLVLEKNHTILLGFDENALNIISELITANENQKKEVIVVMDNMDKTDMEDTIHQRINDTKTTKIICRSGQIDSFSDLSICSPGTCRSIILNLDDDSKTIKAILACVNLLEKSDNQDAYITAIIKDEGNLEAAKIAGGKRAEIIYFKRTIARLMAHATRQPGISTVFTNLLSYDGDEIYVEKLDGAVGHTVNELNLMLPKSIIMGIVKDGEPKVNPPKETIVGADDSLIILEEDDGVSRLKEKAVTDKEAFSPMRDIPDKPYKSLILGSGELLNLVLEELDNYVAPGSVVVVADNKDNDNSNNEKILNLKNCIVDKKTCDIFSNEELEKLVEIKPENVLILTDRSLSDDDADARTLLLLLLLSNIAKNKGMDFTVASEMRKVQNQELAQVTKVNDFVISSNITALMMTQISQTRQQHVILDDLLDDDGSEFYRKSIKRYVTWGIPVDFYTVCESAARYGEIAIGYQKVKGSQIEMVCNPLKSEKIVFGEEDALIVIAED